VSCDLRDLGLGARTLRALVEAGVRDARELTCASDVELLRLPGVGPARLAEIRRQLKLHAVPSWSWLAPVSPTSGGVLAAPSHEAVVQLVRELPAADRPVALWLGHEWAFWSGQACPEGSKARQRYTELSCWCSGAVYPHLLD
jgi:hypothetical protein